MGTRHEMLDETHADEEPQGASKGCPEGEACVLFSSVSLCTSPWDEEHSKRHASVISSSSVFTETCFQSDSQFLSVP